MKLPFSLSEIFLQELINNYPKLKIFFSNIKMRSKEQVVWGSSSCMHLPSSYQENHTKLNQIWHIELHNQGKRLAPCKVPAHMEIKENEEAAKQAIDYLEWPLLTIRWARNCEWENITSKLHYIKPRIKEWESAYNSCR